MIGIQCPGCAGFTRQKVHDSRPVQGMIRRRRECLVCRTRFCTYEQIAARSSGYCSAPSVGCEFVRSMGHECDPQS